MQHLHGGDVQAVFERRADGHVSVVSIARVARLVSAESGWRIENYAGTRPSGGFNRGGIDRQRLERTAGLTAQLGRTVQSAAGDVFASADNGTHCSAARVHRGGCSLHGRAVLVISGKDIRQVLLVHDALHVRVKRRVDAVAARKQRFGAHVQPGFGLIQHGIDEPAVICLHLRRAAGGQFLRHCRVVFRLCQHIFLQHDGQNVLPALAVALRRGLQAVRGWRFDGSSEGGCLRRGQLRRINAERDFCRRLHAVCALSEVDEIQVHVQNLVFRVLLFQLQREVNFLQLARNRLLAGQVGELNQLLGDGGCALTERAVADVGEHGADDARDVKARMLVEAQILRSKERIYDVRGQTRRVDDRTVLLADKRGDVIAVLIVNGAGLGKRREAGRVKRLPIRHGKRLIRPNRAAEQQHQQNCPNRRKHPMPFFLHACHASHISLSILPRK